MYIYNSTREMQCLAVCKNRVTQRSHTQWKGQPTFFIDIALFMVKCGAHRQWARDVLQRCIVTLVWLNQNTVCSVHRLSV